MAIIWIPVRYSVKDILKPMPTSTKLAMEVRRSVVAMSLECNFRQMMQDDLCCCHQVINTISYTYNLIEINVFNIVDWNVIGGVILANIYNFHISLAIQTIQNNKDITWTSLAFLSVKNIRHLPQDDCQEAVYILFTSHLTAIFQVTFSNAIYEWNLSIFKSKLTEICSWGLIDNKATLIQIMAW